MSPCSHPQDLRRFNSKGMDQTSVFSQSSGSHADIRSSIFLYIIGKSGRIVVIEGSWYSPWRMPSKPATITWFGTCMFLSARYMQTAMAMASLAQINASGISPPAAK